MRYLAVYLDNIVDKAMKERFFVLAIGMAVVTALIVSFFALGFNLFLYIFCMCALGVLIFLYPPVGLGIMILATLWFQQWFTLEPIVYGDRIYKLYPLDVVFLITLAAFFFHHFFGKNSPAVRIKREDGVLALFFLLCALFLFRALAAGGADVSTAISAFKNYAFYGLLYYVIVYAVDSVAELKYLLRVFIVGFYGLLAFVVIGLIRGEGLWTEFNPLSTEGLRLLSFPHAFGLALIGMMLFVLFLYRLRPQQTSVYAFWMAAAGILGSLMRHLWISLALVLALLFFVFSKQIKRLAAKFALKNLGLSFVIIVFVGFGMIVFPLSAFSLQAQEAINPLYRRAQSLTDGAVDSSARWRIFGWRAASEALLASPLIGIGYGQELVVDFDTYQVTILTRDLHNSLLVMLVQMGILGGAVFVWFLARMGKRMYAAHKKRGMLYPYQLAIFAGWLLFLAASVWQPYFESNFTGIFFWILSGMLMAGIRIDERPLSTTPDHEPVSNLEFRI